MLEFTIEFRVGLTRAGRALNKHGGRHGSFFPKAIGNPAAKNMQGQYHLDDILTSPNNIVIQDSNRGVKIYSQDGRGLYFRNNSNFRGFLDKQYEK